MFLVRNFQTLSIFYLNLISLTVLICCFQKRKTGTINMKRGDAYFGDQICYGSSGLKK